MWWKVLLIWSLFMVGAIANGAFRVKAIIPLTDEAVGHVISTALLCAIILGITWSTIPWMAPTTVRQVITIGTAWLFMTLAFEFGVGYFVGHHSWREMLADYNILKGRVWVAVPILTFLAPWGMAELRGLLPE
ncbi:MAG: hypothetical protein IPH53_08210 [Flavobacteriales bacterium]|nr:hypothetical protein [Flavobacteriales bacterium]MBK7084638.1 hypothetical protein [Flavobacteriales bacterium]MBK7268930.1 hypothetical protein [Flavobacteriales bacterium]MBK7752237.1 hypothetical protein [Flavobacteriales bacterium]MBK9537816.1 hypothetical protein [Flavobacteriales bacterium]